MDGTSHRLPHIHTSRTWTKQTANGDHHINLEDHVKSGATSPSSTAPETNQQQNGENEDAADTQHSKGHHRKHSETETDVLYENQRGWFFCGIPLFAANSLLQTDPRPWVTAEFKPSPVNITNAQVPDPSWEWRWKTWYVDMSRDVDEEGWEYSMNFRGSSWHGSHPWFHSFVRRRRWLRLRGKRKHALEKIAANANAVTEAAAAVNAALAATDAGTGRSTPIPQLENLKKETASIGTSLVPSRFGNLNQSSRSIREAEEPDIGDIEDIQSLLKYLRKASIDREKTAAVRKFIDTSGDDLYYLAENIPVIMSLLVFQSSRRQLLSDMLAKLSTPYSSPLTSPFVTSPTLQPPTSPLSRTQSTAGSETDQKREERMKEYLLAAIDAAEQQVGKLEFWSDVQDLTHERGLDTSAGAI